MLPERDVERGVLREDRVLQLVKRPSRFDPELREQRAPCRAIGVERFCLAPRAVEREHQLCAQTLAQRLSRDECFELGHQLVVTAERELGLEAVFQRRDVEFVEPCDLVLREPLVRQIRQRRAVPECKCRVQTVQRVGVITGRQGCPALGEEPLEAVAVELVGLEGEAVGAADSSNRVRRQLLAQGRDAVLQHLRRGRRRLVAPQLVDDHVPRQRHVAVQEQESEDSALSRAAERNPSLAVERLDRPEDAVVHGDRA